MSRLNQITCKKTVKSVTSTVKTVTSRLKKKRLLRGGRRKKGSVEVREVGGQGLNRFGWKQRGKLASVLTILPGRSVSRWGGTALLRRCRDGFPRPKDVLWRSVRPRAAPWWAWTWSEMPQHHAGLALCVQVSRRRHRNGRHKWLSQARICDRWAREESGQLDQQVRAEGSSRHSLVGA